MAGEKGACRSLHQTCAQLHRGFTRNGHVLASPPAPTWSTRGVRGPGVAAYSVRITALLLDVPLKHVAPSFHLSLQMCPVHAPMWRSTPAMPPRECPACAAGHWLAVPVLQGLAHALCHAPLSWRQPRQIMCNPLPLLSPARHGALPRTVLRSTGMENVTSQHRTDSRARIRHDAATKQASATSQPQVCTHARRPLPARCCLPASCIAGVLSRVSKPAASPRVKSHLSARSLHSSCFLHIPLHEVFHVCATDCQQPAM